MTTESAKGQDHSSATVKRSGKISEAAHAEGFFTAYCRDKFGRLKWEDNFPNVVCTVGMNLMLDTAFAGAGYTVTGPFLGLISAVTYTGTAQGDTMASHAGWVEAGSANAPTYTGTRKTAVWNAATSGSKALSTPLEFTMTGSGTIKGCFLVYGAGAVNTIDSTTGVLWSAGLFAGGNKIVDVDDIVGINYSTSL